MTRKPVDSSNVKSVGYDAASRILEVEYKSGGLYAYQGVPPQLVAKMPALHVGGWLRRCVQDAYRAVKIHEAVEEREPGPAIGQTLTLKSGDIIVVTDAGNGCLELAVMENECSSNL